jgi:hypothetical protein
MVFAGGPNEIADRILHLHQLLGHTRHILQMDVGGMPQHLFHKSIELLGIEVLPQIRKETPPVPPPRNERLLRLPSSPRRAVATQHLT